MATVQIALASVTRLDVYRGRKSQAGLGVGVGCLAGRTAGVVLATTNHWDWNYLEGGIGEGLTAGFAVS
jgi:hypothetical protein